MPFLCQPSEDSSKTYKSLHLKTNLAPLCLARQERLAVSLMTTTSVQRSSTPLHLHYSFSLNPKCPTSTMESDTSKSTIPFHFSTPTIHRANSPTSQPRPANTSNLANGPLDLLPLLLNTWGQPSDRIFSLCPQHSIPPRSYPFCALFDLLSIPYAILPKIFYLKISPRSTIDFLMHDRYKECDEDNGLKALRKRQWLVVRLVVRMAIHTWRYAFSCSHVEW
jgi:hypothetical protein